MNSSEWTILIGSAIGLAILYYLTQGTTQKIKEIDTKWYK